MCGKIRSDYDLLKAMCCERELFFAWILHFCILCTFNMELCICLCIDVDRCLSRWQLTCSHKRWWWWSSIIVTPIVGFLFKERVHNTCWPNVGLHVHAHLSNATLNYNDLWLKKTVGVHRNVCMKLKANFHLMTDSLIQQKYDIIFPVSCIIIRMNGKVSLLVLSCGWISLLP